jgi:nucleotide-binding universal stress UspA family protein
VRILLAIDGSEHSARTVEEIASRPWPSNSTVRVLSVVEQVATAVPVAVFSAANLETEMDQLTRAAEEMTTRFANWLCSSGLTAESRVRTGDPKSVIIEEAKEWGGDLIVVGSHGQSGIKRWLLGSVAQSVVSQAPCSVHVVREPNQAQSTDQTRTEGVAKSMNA